MTATIPLERIPREEIDRLWAKEAERRLDELDNGKVQAIPGWQGLAEIRKRLGE